jgi:hypothetical protein
MNFLAFVSFFIQNHNFIMIFSLNCHVTDHMTNQVTFLGSWKFFSFLHYPLELQLTLAAQSQEEKPHSELELTSTSRRSSTSTAAATPTTTQQLKVLTLQPQESLPSIVAADSLVGGVRFRTAPGISAGGGQGGGSGEWSKIYPLGSSVHQWSKPHLLAEVCVASYSSCHWDCVRFCINLC